MQPKVVLFDLGGVVCRFHPERRLAALGRACGITPERVESGLYASGLISRWDLGLDSPSEMHRTIQERLGFQGSIRALQEIWCRAFEPDLKVLTLVDAVRPLRTALLTDNDPLLLEAFPDLFPQVASRFDDLFFSCRLGAVKPEPVVFTQALDTMGFAPAEAVFIDDRAANVAAARGLGITAIHFRDPVGLGAALDALLPR
ncbi:HAD family hydrolase [Streptomyces sp. NBC_01264]|uniref:HAD family hydrolase n=1 Tax=Streptomyces sp. NBC_01264 TaxID=2903804 RepID=UPI00225432FC|nr:HAD family phosphatase [Streptomyces sp. NBC_01264]MCX4780319.1 HAD family phosphatase [Streptomyces sp. NBC_01264]